MSVGQSEGVLTARPLEQVGGDPTEAQPGTQVQQTLSLLAVRVGDWRYMEEKQTEWLVTCRGGGETNRLVGYLQGWWWWRNKQSGWLLAGMVEKQTDWLVTCRGGGETNRVVGYLQGWWRNKQSGWLLAGMVEKQTDWLVTCRDGGERNRVVGYLQGWWWRNKQIDWLLVDLPP